MFFLPQEWQDPEDGIEAVLLHWRTTLIEQAPDWRRVHPQTMMMPQPASAPVRRQCTVWVVPPGDRKSQADGDERSTRFFLHSFYEVIQRGRTWTTGVTKQEIRSVMVSHPDPSAECTHAILYYSLDNLAHVSCVPMFLAGLSTRSHLVGAMPEDYMEDKDLQARMKRAERIARLPRPHIFQGYVWGPAGAHAFYSVYLRRDGACNPFSERGFWLLRNGNLWEVAL